MAEQPTVQTMADDLRRLASESEGWDEHEQAERERLAARVDAAIELVRRLEAELGEIRLDLE